MKAIRINPASDRQRITLYADSAISRDVSPIFIPDIASKWAIQICVAVRLGRLGKNISPKFVHRYIDAISAVGLLTPLDEGHLAQEGVMSILDSAVTTGKWLGLSEEDTTEGYFNLEANPCISLKVGEQAKDFDIEALDIAGKVADVSKYATLKNGDIIIMSSASLTTEICTGQRVECSLGTQTCLNLKIK